VADAVSQAQTVTSDSQPEEQVEAAVLPKPGDVVANSIGMKLVYIPAGSFMMGSSDSAAQLARRYIERKARFENEFPQHEVRISKGFWMGQTEVTQGQYKAIMGAVPWSGGNAVQQSDNNPAVYVSWNEAAEFCRKLSRQEGMTYRLPTEAEWEYACRAGTTTRYSFGDSDSSLGDYAWFDGNTEKVGQTYAHLVGQKIPNPWGLYDMHGNVFEWCSDWYYEKYYSNSPSVDPKGPSSGLFRSLRGGSWLLTEFKLRCSYRENSGNSGVQGFLVGFRVVRSGWKKTSREESPSQPVTSDTLSTEQILQKPLKEDTPPTESIVQEPLSKADGGAKMTVKLLDPGAQPRKALRYKFQANRTEKMVMETSMAMVMEIRGQKRLETQVPATRMTMSIDSKEVSPEGDLHYEFELEQVEVLPKPGANPATINAMKQQMSSMQGLRGSATVTSRGFTKDTEIRPPPGIDLQNKQSMDEMKKSMDRMSAPLPEEPVGRGASWQVTMPVETLVMELAQVVTYTLTEI
ncbi:MAG: formylglycine-generating enzyme family protein, partial [Planctomycetota bacterium]